MLTHSTGSRALPLALLNHREPIEILPPASFGARLHFQVFCNGLPIGHARLEKLEAPVRGRKVIGLFEARCAPGHAVYILKMIQVAQNYRNRGIGTLLMGEVLHYCRNHHIQSLVGEIKGEMALLRRWYSRTGFTIAAGAQLQIRLD